MLWRTARYSVQRVPNWLSLRSACAGKALLRTRTDVSKSPFYTVNHRGEDDAKADVHRTRRAVQEEPEYP